MKNDNIQVFHLSITVVWKFLNRPHYWLRNKHILNKTSFTHTHTQTHACVCVQACVCVTSSMRKRTQNVLQKICRQATTLPQLQALWHVCIKSTLLYSTPPQSKQTNRDSRNSVSGTVLWDCFWWSSSNCILNVLNLRNPTTTENLWQKLLEKIL